MSVSPRVLARLITPTLAVMGGISGFYLFGLSIRGVEHGIPAGGVFLAVMFSLVSGSIFIGCSIPWLVDLQNKCDPITQTMRAIGFGLIFALMGAGLRYLLSLTPLRVVGGQRLGQIIAVGGVYYGILSAKSNSKAVVETRIGRFRHFILILGLLLVPYAVVKFAKVL